MHSHRHTIVVLFLAGALAQALACGAAKEPAGQLPSPPVGMGQLAVSLVDTPAPAAEQIWVNVTGVTAHSDTSGWVTVSSVPRRLDLLKLQSEAASLGFADLPPGRITQVRLLLSPDGNSIVAGGSEHPLQVPSGCESGIKIQGPWEIAACNRTALTIDFDGKKSIWYHPTGQGDQWILRPVIHVRKAELVPVSCDDAGSGGAPGGGGTVTCDATKACPEGTLCVAGACKKGGGDPCGSGSECASGVCDATSRCGQGGPDAPCSAGAQCLAGVCSGGRCGAGGPDDPCEVGAQCASGSCLVGRCGPGTAGGAGSACTAREQCLSRACMEGACAPGGQGSLCVRGEDCVSGLTCQAGSCMPMP